MSIALKLTFEGNNQFKYFEAWVFTIVAILCCLMQIKFLNKVIYKAFLFLYNHHPLRDAVLLLFLYGII